MLAMEVMECLLCSCHGVHFFVSCQAAMPITICSLFRVSAKQWLSQANLQNPRFRDNVTLAYRWLLDAEIARALAPRSVTVALALPIAAQLQAPASIAAAGVALTGLLGSNSVQILLDKLGYKDPIARGLATAGASHGLGTAALSGK